jgi:hypothetical protein
MLIEHKGRTYLETKVESSLETRYIDASGNELAADDVRPFLPARGKSRQGTAREVVVRDYALDSIRSLRFRGEDHVMLQEVAATAPVATPAAPQSTNA